MRETSSGPFFYIRTAYFTSMADFCSNCLLEIELGRFRHMSPEQRATLSAQDQEFYTFLTDSLKNKSWPTEMAGLVTEEEVKNGKYGVVLCESCDYTLVDHNGYCMTDCKYKHGDIVIPGRP